MEVDFVLADYNTNVVDDAVILFINHTRLAHVSEQTPDPVIELLMIYPCIAFDIIDGHDVAMAHQHEVVMSQKTAIQLHELADSLMGRSLGYFPWLFELQYSNDFLQSNTLVELT